VNASMLSGANLEVQGTSSGGVHTATKIGGR
jgi:hypothetical protein